MLNTIKEGDYERIKNSLKKLKLSQFVSTNQDSRVWKLLNESVSCKYPMITKLLLAKFQKVNFPSSVGSPLILTAVRKESVQTIAVLVSFGADLNICWNKTTPLYEAMKSGSMKLVEVLLEKGADPSFQDESCQTPLHFAIKTGNLELFKFLLEKGANLNVCDKFKETLIHFGVKNGNLEFVKLMLEKGTDVNTQDFFKNTPLHFAVENGNLELVKCLLEKGAKIEAKRNCGRRPLHLAASGSHEEIVHFLLEKGADVNASNDEEKTPLIEAIKALKATNINIVKLLINKGADVEVKTWSNKRPLHYASKGSLEILKFLLNMGVAINVKNDKGFTPLYYAAKNQNLENVSFLLKHGARLCIEDKRHEDLSQLAIDSTPEILKLILEYHENLHFEKHCFIADDSREIDCLENILILVEHGLNSNIEITYDSTEASLLFHAMNKSLDMVVRLLEAGADANRESMYMDLPVCYRHISDYYTPLYAAIFAEVFDDYGFRYKSNLVTILLQYGADVNLFPDMFHEDYFFEVELYDSLFEFTRHIALMSDQKLEVDERILDLIGKEAKLCELYKKCEKEIETLKAEKVNGTPSSFFDLLAMNARELAAFARNKCVVEGLEGKGSYEAKFPIYGSAITLQLEMGLRRRDLLNQVAKSCHVIFPCLPRSCSEEIFSYLDNKDIRILINISQRPAIRN